MDTEIETVEFSLTSDCQCQTENDETGEFEPSNECFGDCYENQTEDFSFIVLDPWITANDWERDTPIRIYGRRMNWNSRAGWLDTTAEEITTALAIDSDFTLKFKLNGKTLVVNRYSHDEPVGSPEFTFVKLDECETCGEHFDKTNGESCCSA